jgi:hypothetical protein
VKNQLLWTTDFAIQQVAPNYNFFFLILFFFFVVLCELHFNHTQQNESRTILWHCIVTALELQVSKRAQRMMHGGHRIDNIEFSALMKNFHDDGLWNISSIIIIKWHGTLNFFLLLICSSCCFCCVCC